MHAVLISSISLPIYDVEGGRVTGGGFLLIRLHVGGGGGMVTGGRRWLARAGRPRRGAPTRSGCGGGRWIRRRGAGFGGFLGAVGGRGRRPEDVHRTGGTGRGSGSARGRRLFMQRESSRRRSERRQQWQRRLRRRRRQIGLLSDAFEARWKLENALVARRRIRERRTRRTCLEENRKETLRL